MERTYSQSGSANENKNQHIKEETAISSHFAQPSKGPVKGSVSIGRVYVEECKTVGKEW